MSESLPPSWSDWIAGKPERKEPDFIERIMLRAHATPTEPSDWVLVLIAIVIAYVAICHPEWVEWSM